MPALLTTQRRAHARVVRTTQSVRVFVFSRLGGGGRGGSVHALDLIEVGGIEAQGGEQAGGQGGGRCSIDDDPLPSHPARSLAGCQHLLTVQHGHRARSSGYDPPRVGAEIEVWLVWPQSGLFISTVGSGSGSTLRTCLL